jgi:hypothetical protein
MNDPPSSSSDELPMTEDQDVLNIVIRKLDQHRIYAPDQMIERLSARPINHPNLGMLKGNPSYGTPPAWLSRLGVQAGPMPASNWRVASSGQWARLDELHPLSWKP